MMITGDSSHFLTLITHFVVDHGCYLDHFIYTHTHTHILHACMCLPTTYEIYKGETYGGPSHE